MLEIEVKYPLADRAAVVAQLVTWGATTDAPRTDVDHYFNGPDRDFKQTDESFRVRRIGERNFITYKGPKIETETKTRTEIELSIAGGDAGAADAQRMLVCLGYKPVAVVRKTRAVYHFPRDGFDLEACLDDVDKVGPFVELEIVADESRFADAKAVVLAVAAELGLTQQERRSYLELTLSRPS
jgi:adenylate cyclase, class 2